MNYKQKYLKYKYKYLTLKNKLYGGVDYSSSDDEEVNIRIVYNDIIMLYDNPKIKDRFVELRNNLNVIASLLDFPTEQGSTSDTEQESLSPDEIKTLKIIYNDLLTNEDITNIPIFDAMINKDNQSASN